MGLTSAWYKGSVERITDL